MVLCLICDGYIFINCLDLLLSPIDITRPLLIVDYNTIDILAVSAQIYAKTEEKKNQHQIKTLLASLSPSRPCIISAASQLYICNGHRVGWCDIINYTMLERVTSNGHRHLSACPKDQQKHCFLSFLNLEFSFCLTSKLKNELTINCPYISSLIFKN